MRRHGAFFGAGLMALAAQVVLLRELVVDVAGDELALGVGLAAWLVGIAAGAAGGRRRRPRHAATDAAVGLSLLALLPFLGIVGGRVVRSVVGPPPGELPGLGLTLSLAVLTLVPPGLLVGWTFTTLAAAASREWDAGEAITRVYVAESLGSLVGGVAVACLVGPYLSPLPATALLGAGAMGLALLVPRGGAVSARPLLAVATGLSLALFAVSGWLDSWSERARFAGVAPGVSFEAALATPWQHLALGASGGVWHLYGSGQYVASFPDEYGAESLGHLIGCLAPRPGRVLLIGAAERGLARVLLRHPVSALILVEPDPWADAFVHDHLADADRAALEDPRVEVVHDDPRRFLARTRDRFGLVVVLGPDPVSLLRARLGTVEFFRLCASRLAPDGVLVAGVRTAPNVLVGETAALAGSVYGALREALPVVRATPGPDTLLVAGASREAATLDASILARRWDERGIRADTFAAALLPALLPPGRVAAQETALRDASAAVEPSRDDRPASLLHALARRQQTTAGVWGRTLTRLSGRSLPWLVVFALLPSLVAVMRLHLAPGPSVRRAASAASHAVAVAGAAGMGFSLLLLLSFQTRVGALFGALGALTAAFMLGLSLGALLGRRAVDVAHGGPGASTALGNALAVALVYAVTLPWTLAAAARVSDSGLAEALLAHGGLLLAAGLVTGAPFPLAAELRLAAGDGPGEAAGRLETADHVGAAAAALVGAVLFIPTLGFTRCAWLLAALLALALGGLLVAIARRPDS